mgnify:CR=1 FL=1
MFSSLQISDTLASVHIVLRDTSLLNFDKKVAIELPGVLPKSIFLANGLSFLLGIVEQKTPPV